MSKEMAGIDIKVGEIGSSFGEGKVDIVYTPPSDFEGAVKQLVRKHCVPDETTYENSPDLKNDPVKAAQHIRLENYPYEPAKMPLSQTLLIAAAKVEAAKETLELTPAQQGVFEGLGQNIAGLERCIDGGMKFTREEEKALKSEGFYLGPASGIDSSPHLEIVAGKFVKKALPGLLVLGMATSCNQLPLVPIAAIFPGPAETETVTATEMATPTPLENIPYPSSSETFDLTAESLSGSEADSKIKSIGTEVANEYSALRSWYIQNGIKEANLVPLYYNGKNGIHWDLGAKADDGNFLSFTLTSGPEKGQLVRSVGLVSYLYQRPLFTTSEIANPSEYPNAVQKVLWDRSGWNIVGVYDGGKLVAWRDNESGGVWRVVENGAATAIPTEKETPSETWQLSPDGHVYYNESELYGGLFTINKEHPEYVETYWENMISGIWNLNYVSENNTFLKEFPTSDSLLKYLKDGGGPVSNLWIPVIYPNGGNRYLGQATMQPVDGKVDLTKIAIGIYKPTKDEIYKYSPSYASGNRYITFEGTGDEIFVENVNDVSGTNMLKFTFRSDVLADTNYTTSFGEYTKYAITDSKDGKDNLIAINWLLNLWIYESHMPKVFHDEINDGAIAWVTNTNPPILNTQVHGPTPQQEDDFATSANSPLKIR